MDVYPRKGYEPLIEARQALRGEEVTACYLKEPANVFVRDEKRGR